MRKSGSCAPALKKGPSGLWCWWREWHRVGNRERGNEKFVRGAGGDAESAECWGGGAGVEQFWGDGIARGAALREGVERGEVGGGREGVAGAGEGVCGFGAGRGGLFAGGGNDGSGKSGDEASVARFGRRGAVDREADGDGSGGGFVWVGEVGIVE